MSAFAKSPPHVRQYSFLETVSTATGTSIDGTVLQDTPTIASTTTTRRDRMNIRTL
jgi:hypothetical protein